MELNACIKEEIDEEVIRVKEESLDDMTTLANATESQQTDMQIESYSAQSLHVKEELLFEDDWFLDSATAQPVSPSFALKGETCDCTGDCDDCQTRIKSNGSIKEEIDEKVIAVKEEPMDETMTIVNTTDCNEVSHQIDVQLESHCEQLLHVKEELHPEDVSLAIPPTRPVSPSFAIKGETCQCPGEHCDDCLEADQSKEITGHVSFPVSCSGDNSDKEPSDWNCIELRDSVEAIVDAPVIISAAPVSNTCAATSARSPPCPECGKTFVSNSYLKKHLRVHTGERPYVCAQCPKAFKQLGQLKEHQVTHQAVRSRPFDCTAEGCGKAFTTKQKLTVHFQSHTGDKPFKCDNCGKAFLTKQQLTIHYRSHTGDRPYQCPLCPKAFSQSSHARRHQRAAHPNEP